jgi:elongation factor Ts
MATITAAMVAQLRERTGLGMMECKKALTETDGELELAVEFLQKKGVKDRGDKVSGEGLVMGYISADKLTGVLVEINSETDFVARNEDFKALCRQMAEGIAGSSATTPEAFLAEGTNQNVFDEATKRIGERLILGRFAKFAAPAGSLVTLYVHSTTGSGADGGRKGVLVETVGAGTDDLGKEVAMHISFAKPKYLSESEVPEAEVAKIREIETARTMQDPKMEGKPAAAIEAATNGRVKKSLGEFVLLQQPSVREPSKTIDQLVKETAGAAITRYARFEVGENAPKGE